MKKDKKITKEARPEPEVIKVRTYTFVHTDYADGTSNLLRTNDGFNAFELLGLLELTRADIIVQFDGGIKPTTITRQIVKEQEK